MPFMPAKVVGADAELKKLAVSVCVLSMLMLAIMVVADAKLNTRYNSKP